MRKHKLSSILSGQLVFNSQVALQMRVRVRVKVKVLVSKISTRMSEIESLSIISREYTTEC